MEIDPSTPSGSGCPSGSGSGSNHNKRPLDNSGNRTPLPKRPNIENSHTDIIRVEVSKVIRNNDSQPKGL